MKVFTKLMAAFALLAFLAFPLGMRGQTTVSYGWETSDDATKWTISDAIVATDGQGNTGTYAGKINTNHTYVQFNEKVYVTSFSFAFKRTSNNSNYNVYIETSTDGNTWTAAETYAMGSFSNGTYSTKTKTFDGTTEYYVRFHCYNTTAVRYVDDVTITYSGGTPTPTTYTVTYDCNGGTSGCPQNVTGIEAGIQIQLADAPSRDNYDFDGWSDGTTTYGENEDYTVNGDVTFTAQWTEQSSGDVQWVLTDLADLTESDVFVIVGNDDNNYAMANDKGTSSAPTAVAVTVENEAITGTVAANIQWNISGNATEGYTFYPNGTTETWLYCTNTNNGVRVGTNANKSFVINSDYLYNTATSRHIGIYNSQDWRCYSPSASGVHSNIAGQTFAFYKKVTGGVLPPSITAANVEIAYYATSGSIAYTINNEPDPVGTLTASTESDWLTLDTVGETVSFTCTANEVNTERTATVTLTYTYGDNQAITKDVTVTQAGDPNAVNNISDITEVGANYQVKGMVVATNARGFIIGDGTGYVYTYLNAAPTQSVGDNLFISGTTGSYGHVIQFTNTATIDTVAETNYNGEPQPIVITEVPDYSEGYHLSTYLQFEGNLTKSGSNYEVAIGESKIRISYPTTDQTSALAALVNKTVRVHGFFTGISGTNGNSVFTAMMESVEDITPAVPSITVTPSEINATYTETEGTLAITYENIPELISFDYYFCNAEGTELEDTDPNYPDWIDAEIQEDTLYYLIGENDGEARTAYLKVYTYDEELEEVYAIVTVNQAAVEAPNVTWDLSAASYVQSEDPVAPTSELITWTSDFATMTNEKGQGSTGVNNFIPPTQTSTRFYKNNVLTITPTSGYAITSVVFTATTAGYAGALKNSTWVNATASVEEKIVTVTPTDGCSEIIATMGGTCGFTAVTVYYVPDTAPAITVSPATLNVDAQPHLVNYLSLTYKNIVADSANSFTVHYYDAEGVEYEPVPGEVWMYAQMVGSANVYQVICTIVANQGEARTAYFKVSAQDAENDTVYSNLVTVNQEAAPQQYTLTVDPFENLELITFVNDSMVMEADGQIQVTEGAQIMLSIVALEGYEMKTLMVNGVNHVDDIADDFTYSFVMPSEDVTISATALEVVPFAPALYTKVTSIVAGQRYIIVGFNGIDAYAMGGQTSNNRAAIVISEDRNTAVVTNESVAEFVIGSSGDFFTMNDGTGYLYAASSNSNYLRTETVLDNNGKWAITIAEDGQADVVAQGSNSRKYMRYNVTSTVFSCYAENSNVKDKVYFYVKSSEAPTADNVVVEGTDFGTIENPTNTGYRLIASPVNNVNPAAVEGMTSGNYDLYAYNANEDDEWINHKTAKFHLVSGHGYLYAKDTVVNLNFVGQPITDFEGVELDYAEGDALKSLTLVGNPFFHEADFVVANNGTNADFNYLTLNSDGDGFVVGNTNGSQAKTLAPMEAMFVQAPEANYKFLCGNCMGGEPGIPDSNHGLLNLKVTRNRGQVIDNALVSFGNAPMMNKLMLNEKATKVYVPVGGKEMAVVRVQAEGEMPVNFKAENDGTYTLSVNAENVEMNYLHLVDNMTGADVDLLATPNYTFEAKTSDYESRFRLVFASISDDAEGNQETFAYFNGSEWVVSNIGESTLQVVDVMGRVLSSETVSGNATVSISQMPGVYMLRLVNGNQVKVQKVVVR